MIKKFDSLNHRFAKQVDFIADVSAFMTLLCVALLVWVALPGDPAPRHATHVSRMLAEAS